MTVQANRDLSEDKIGHARGAMIENEEHSATIELPVDETQLILSQEVNNVSRIDAYSRCCMKLKHFRSLSSDLQ